jgi:hypothetical protein
VTKVVDLLQTLPSSDKLYQHEEEVTNLVASNDGLIGLEKDKLIEILELRAPNSTLSKYLQVNNRKCEFNAKVSYALAMYNKILDEYGSRAKKAHLNGGVDWKALSHAVRVNNEAIELLTTSIITFPRPDRELLVNIKTGQIPYNQVAEIIEKGLVDLLEAQKNSKLREVPDYEFINQLIYDVYSGIVREGL